MARTVLYALTMTTHSRCSRCNGSHSRCNGCGAAYPLTSTACFASGCREASLVCRCGIVVAAATAELDG